MKAVQSVVFRALSFLLVGGLMVAFPHDISTWLVQAIGILFLIPGLVSLASYFRTYSRNDSTRQLLPIIGIGSIVLGLLLILMPSIFLKALNYVLAAALLLAGIASIANIIHFRRYTPVGVAYYVIPVLLCAVGIFIIVKQQSLAEAVVIIFGYSAIVYGLCELFYAVRFRKVLRTIYQDAKKRKAAQEAAKVSEQASNTDNTMQLDSPAVESPGEHPTDTQDNPAQAVSNRDSRDDQSSADTTARADESQDAVIDFSQESKSK